MTEKMSYKQKLWTSWAFTLLVFDMELALSLWLSLSLSFLIHRCIIIIWICVMSHVHPSVWPAFSLAWQKLLLDITHKLTSCCCFFFFIPAMLIDTIDFYHFIPLSLTWPCLGVTMLAERKLFWLHFWSGWNLMWWWRNLSWISETLACVWAFANSRLGIMIDSTEFYHLIIVQIPWTFSQGHNCVRKQNSLGCYFFHIFSQGICMKSSMVLQPVKFVKVQSVVKAENLTKWITQWILL